MTLCAHAGKKGNYGICCLVLCTVLGASSCLSLPPTPEQPGPPDGPWGGPSPDVIVDDMYFVATPGNTSEFPTYDLHVKIKNIGGKKAGAFSVHVYKTTWLDNTSGIGFVNVIPKHMQSSLDADDTEIYVWKNVATIGEWGEYWLAVVDLPTEAWPLGRVVEKPVDKAEKNNTLAIPCPME